LGTIVGASVGVVYGVQKVIKGTGPPQAYVPSLFPPTFIRVINILTYDPLIFLSGTVGRDVASSNVVGRGAGTPEKTGVGWTR
jgi:hypothetical protein